MNKCVKWKTAVRFKIVNESKKNGSRCRNWSNGSLASTIFTRPTKIKSEENNLVMNFVYDCWLFVSW